MHHNFSGKRYKIKYETAKRLGKFYGKCDNPTKKNKTIKIMKGLSPKLELEVIIHESSHCCRWHECEESVDQFAKDLSSLLWRLGYRKVEI